MLIALDEHGFSHTIMLTQSREHGTHSQTETTTDTGLLQNCR
jgi:hypothetical protein